MERDPEPFLSLGLVTEEWLGKALPSLVQAEKEAPLEGEAFLHLDIRSDNICLLEDHVVFIDWNHACLGNSAFDIAAWLPSLSSEGGPIPWEILSNSPASPQ